MLIHAASPFDNEKYQRLLFRSEFAGEPVIHRPLEHASSPDIEIS